VTVDYAGTDGTHGTLTFAPGDASEAFQVPVVDDNVHTGTRTVNLTLSNPGGGTSLGSQSSAALNIADDEPASSASTDKAAPKLKITAKKLQKALKTKKLVFKVKSNEAASLKVTAKIRKGTGKHKKVVVVQRASKKVGAGKTVTITIKLKKKALRTLRKALVKGKVKVVLSVKGTDAAHNSATVTKTITVK
jgi:ribosomal protein S24E